MKVSQRDQLSRELQQAGASRAEVAELLPLATRLHQLADQPLPARAATTKSPAVIRIFKPLLAAAAGLAIGIVVITTSQSVPPTSWLYPVQRMSDSVAIAVHPQYRATVMMKRAQQVNSLVAAHARSQAVFATLNDYVAQAKAYKSMPGAHYAAFEFCKSNLQQASNNATPMERRAIQTSLKSLENV